VPSKQVLSLPIWAVAAGSWLPWTVCTSLWFMWCINLSGLSDDMTSPQAEQKKFRICSMKGAENHVRFNEHKSRRVALTPLVAPLFMCSS
jgi:hypothetical protein